MNCTKVAVTELRENTFCAAVTLQLNGREVEIDSRPSDALALAVRTGAGISARAMAAPSSSARTT